MRCLRGVITALVLAVGAATAFADPTQFASFSQATGDNLPFRFINNGTSSVFGLYDAAGNPTSTIVNFQYQTANDLGKAPGENFNALMTFTSNVNGAAVVLGGTSIFQAMTNVSIAFRSLDNTQNYLTLTTGTTGVLQGDTGQSTTAQFGTDINGAPNVVNYTSDFLDFSGTFANKNYSISLANVQPIVSVNNGTFDSFVASGAGTFGSDPVPPPHRTPEPGSLALVGAVMLGGLAVRRRFAR